MRSLSVIILACISLLSVQCSSKKDSPKEVAPLGLRLGVSLDSAKILTTGAGWHCVKDTVTTSDYIRVNGKIVLAPRELLTFNSLRFPNMKCSFDEVLVFSNNALDIISTIFHPDQDIKKPMADSLPTHTFQDYKQFVGVMESVYGTPSDSGFYLPGSIQKDVVTKDTLFYTHWGHPVNRGDAIYTVDFYTRHGSLNFNGLSPLH
jgi:hypothetical protein